MKIGLFMDDYFPSMNGVIYVMDNYAKRLGKVAEVVVVVPYVDKEYKDDFPYRVIRVKSKRMGKVGYSFLLLGAIRGCVRGFWMRNLILFIFIVLSLWGDLVYGLERRLMCRLLGLFILGLVMSLRGFLRGRLLIGL